MWQLSSIPTTYMRSVAAGLLSLQLEAPVSDFIDILSPFYEPLQYPLLFPYGEDGWSGQRVAP